MKTKDMNTPEQEPNIVADTPPVASSKKISKAKLTLLVVAASVFVVSRTENTNTGWTGDDAGQTDLVYPTNPCSCVRSSVTVPLGRGARKTRRVVNINDSIITQRDQSFLGRVSITN